MYRIDRVLTLPEEKRRVLSGVHGRLITPADLDRSKPILAVGDICSSKLLESGVRPDVIIIDGKTRRGVIAHPPDEQGYTQKRVKNPPGCLTPELFDAIGEAESNARNGIKTRILIDGEEDLSVIPLIMIFPLGSQIVYGVPGVGMAMLIITSEFRVKAQRLIEEME